MIRKSMPSGNDPMGGCRFSLATNAKRFARRTCSNKRLERDDHRAREPGGDPRGDDINRRFEAAGAAGAFEHAGAASRAVWEPADHLAGGARPARAYHHLAAAA